MFAQLRSILNFLIPATCLVASVYIYLNLNILYWFIVDPQSYWDICCFFSVSAFVMSIILPTFGIYLASLSKLGKDSIFYGIPIGLFVFSYVLINIPPTIFFPNSASENFEPLDKVEEYFDDASYEKSIDVLTELKNKYTNYQTSKFWFVKDKFLKSEEGIRIVKNREYQIKQVYGTLLILTGDKVLAEEPLTEATLIAENYFSDDKRAFLPLAYQSLSGFYRIIGDIYKSEEIYNKYNKIKSKSEYQYDVIDIVQMLIDRTLYYYQFGDTQSALDLYKMAYEIYAKSDESKENYFYKDFLLGYIRANLKNRTIDKLGDLLSEIEDLVGNDKNSTEYLDFLCYQAEYEDYIGNINKSEELYNKLIDELRPNSLFSFFKSKKTPIERLPNLRSYAKFILKTGKFKEAQKIYTELLSRYSSIGITPPELMTSIIKINFGLENKKTAARLSLKADSLFLNESLPKLYQVASIREKESISRAIENHFLTTNSVYLSSNLDVRLGSIYNNILATKSVSLLSQNHIEEFLILNADSTLLSTYKYLKTEKERLDNSLFSMNDLNLDYQSQFDKISFQEKELYNKLNNNDEFSPYDITDVNWEMIQSNLSENELAIEFVGLHRDPNNTDSLRYFALIIDSISKFPKIIELCSQKEIKGILNSQNNLIDRINSIYSDVYNSDLYKKIWAPLDSCLKNKSQVYVSLSGLLNSISIPALTIDEPYSVKVLSSTRQIIEIKSTKPNVINKSLVFGGVDYDLCVDDSLISRGQMTLSDSSFYRSIQDFNFENLPGTLAETQAIENLLDDHNINKIIRTGASASEVSFRNLIEFEKPNHIHIASHGFYFPKKRSIVMKNNIFKIENDYSIINNPLFRSGLLFAGANNKQKPSFANDGVLTANEIAAFNLSDVDLVVLSACETGLGDVIGNEGVFGLQRAFKMAGANKLLMSLWKVPDRETTILMKEFYKYLFDGYDAHAALKKAQNKMREIYPEPFNWAGFFVLD